MKKFSLDIPGQKPLQFEVEGRPQHADPTWFRGDHCNFNPQLVNMVSQDSVLKHVISGWAPEQPLIGKDTKIVAFGSCFAENITKWLSDRGYAVLNEKGGADDTAYVVRFGEGMVNTFAIRQQFEWAFENKNIDGYFWHDQDGEVVDPNEVIRNVTRDLFLNADIFIITAGLSEVWYDKTTGEVFWHAVPESQYDAGRHKFRVSSVQENKDNLHKIYNLIKTYRPEAKTIFTLSPIPLVATFRPVSCISANYVSKSILRAALDEVIREINEPTQLYYWPSYEIVMDVFSNRWKLDRRHIKKPILDFVMTLFETVWCHGGEPRMALSEAWSRARSCTNDFPQNFPDALDTDDADSVEQIYTAFNRTKQTQEAQLVIDTVAEFIKSRPNSRLATWLGTVLEQAD